MFGASLISNCTRPLLFGFYTVTNGNPHIHSPHRIWAAFRRCSFCSNVSLLSACRDKCTTRKGGVRPEWAGAVTRTTVSMDSTRPTTRGTRCKDTRNRFVLNFRFFVPFFRQHFGGVVLQNEGWNFLSFAAKKDMLLTHESDDNWLL